MAALRKNGARSAQRMRKKCARIRHHFIDYQLKGKNKKINRKLRKKD